MQNLLILTVGTGTAGKKSDLAQGLLNTIEKIQPRKFWLVPSTSEISQNITKYIVDYINEFGGNPGFAGRLGPIEKPDDLSCCRQTLRKAIRAVKQEWLRGEKLMVNPTSGTKQMSAGATIAALDEECGDIVFTIGERADGVVKTGTEQVVKFDSVAYFRERDCNTAAEFFRAGDFYAAERLLYPHREREQKAYALAAVCLHWRRFDYSHAASFAATCDQELKKCLTLRRDVVRECRFCEDIVADIMAWARFALRCNDFEDAVRLVYKALEYVARVFLERDFKLSPDANGMYPSDTGDILNLSSTCRKQLRSGTDKLALGLSLITAILKDLKHPFGEVIDKKLLKLSQLRNQNTHGILPVEKEKAESYYANVQDKLGKLFPGFKPTDLPVKDLPFADKEHA